jgi:hypothetical protein
MCLPDLDHNWPRYVLPAGAALSLSDGFLPDPDGRYEQYSNPGLLSLTEFFNPHCCILLGDAGIGKSDVLRMEYERVRGIATRLGTVIFRSLRDFGSDATAEQFLSSPEIKTWIADDTAELFLFLDSLDEPIFPHRLIAHQDMQELRNERAVYHAALAVVMQLGRPKYDYDSAQQHIKTIADNVREWPSQWERERTQRQTEPRWKLREESLKRIEGLPSLPPDLFLPDSLGGNIVICELVNSFPATAFPNPAELHGSIRFGIRPLLYAILRRHLFKPMGFFACLNEHCRPFFSIERSGQRFCSPECSIRHRQRVYWREKGKKLRKDRTARRRKLNK